LDKVTVAGEKVFCPLGEKLAGFPPDTVQTMSKSNVPPPGAALTGELAQLTVMGAEGMVIDNGAIAIPEKLC